jgi:hypothetical protein
MGSIERFLAHAGVACCFFIALPLRAEDSAAGASPSRAQCLQLHEQAQSARLQGELLAARAALRECASAACPGLVTRDCVDWLQEVERQMPSVIFRGEENGDDLVELRVSEGDKLLTASLTGTPLELDPGPHHFTAELAGFPVQHATYVLQAGDKARVVLFEFKSPAPKPPAPAAAPSASPEPERSRPVPLATYVLGGSALLAAATGSGLGLAALARRNDVRDSCAPLCTDRDLRGFKNLALASDLSFGVALLSAGAAAYAYLARPGMAAPKPQRASANTNLRVVWTGRGVVAGGSF